jgi:hypothetical protein
MRMAMRFLEWPVAMRRARLSSASVNSGMSEKSIWQSGIGLMFFRVGFGELMVRIVLVA